MNDSREAELTKCASPCAVSCRAFVGDLSPSSWPSIWAKETQFVGMYDVTGTSDKRVLSNLKATLRQQHSSCVPGFIQVTKKRSPNRAWDRGHVAETEGPLEQEWPGKSTDETIWPGSSAL